MTDKRLTEGLRSMKLKGSSSKLRDAIVEHAEWAYTQGEIVTLKAVGEYLQPCPHMEGRIRRVCYRCLNELLQALKEGRMP